MTHKRLNYLLIFILAVNILFTASMYFKNKNSLELLQSKITSKSQQKDVLRYEMLTELLMGNAKMLYRYENKNIEDLIISNMEGKKMYLSSMLNKSYKLIFKFNKNNCSSCIESELKSITNIAERIGNDRIIILTEGQGLRQVASFIKERNLKIPVYMISEGKMDILEKENVPFVCVMNKDLRVELLFIPIKELQGFSEQYYYSSVISRFFLKEKP